MNQSDVIRLALVLAAQAEIEGMKAENRARKYEGLKVLYQEDDFRVKAMELKRLAFAPVELRPEW